MTNFTATGSVETLTGDAANDEFRINKQSYINAGDVYDGGDGNDILWLTKGMMGIDMPGNLDFRQVSIFNMEILAFNYMKMAMPGQAIFNSDQFGTGLLSNNLEVRGAWGDTDITVHLASGDTSFSAAGWTFPNTATVNSTSSQAMGTPTPAGDAYSAWGPYIYTGSSSMMVTSGQEVGGNDTIHLIGSDGANTITGSSQADIIAGGLGSDVLNGGAGTDTADYTAITGDISVTLNGATAATVTVAGGDNDSIVNFENITGGSGNDSITGDAAANVLSGGAGDDTLSGGSGGDTLIGGTGSDSLDGGASTDVADYSAMSNDLSVTLNGATNAVVTVTGGENDTIRNIENVTGGSGNDSITGDSLANTIRGGAGADTLDGGANNDTLDYTGMSNGISVTLTGATDATVTVTGGQNDTIRNFENVTGGSGNDSITGDSGTNVLRGGAGTNTLNGADGNDILYADYGVENLQGGNGNDNFYVNRQTHLNTGDVFDGGDGTDVVWAGKGMSNYEENFNFSAVTFTSIEGLSFNYMGMSMPGSATFSSSQFGAGLSNTLEVRGSWGNNDITVNLAAGSTSFDASGWTFPTANGTNSGTSTYAWGSYIYTGSTPNTDVGGTDTIHLNGSAGDNAITGTIKNDIIDGAGGTDTAIFSGNRSDYTVTQNGAEFTLADARSVGTGTDKVSNIETFQFADGSYTAAQLLSGDNTAPTVSITGGPANGSSTTATSATITWSGNDNTGTGIAHYLYSTDNGVTWTTTTETSVTLTGLIDGLQNFQIKAVDAAGNEGPLASDNWSVDTTAPLVSITGGPVNGSSTSATSATLTWSGSDGTGTGVDHYVYSTDNGATWTSTSNTSVTLTGLSDGPQSFTVKAVDEVGNESIVASNSWTVDATAPTVVMTDGPEAGVRTNLTSATFSWSGSDGAGAGIDHYQYSTDGGSTWTTTAATSVTLDGLADGEQTFELQAVDGDGNTSEIISSSWTVDSSVPYQASTAIDNLVGRDGDEDFITNKQAYLNPGDLFDGGSGTDTLWAGQGMGEFEPDGLYDTDYDFSNVTIRNMEALSFNWMPMPMPGKAVFSSEQFGEGLLSENLMVYGAWDNQTITVNLTGGNTAFDASGWQFANSGAPSGMESAVWGHYTYTGTDMGGMYTGMDVGGTDTIRLNGSSGNNAITGTSMADVINGLAGNDTMVGGGGDDSYFVNARGDVTTEDSAGGGIDRVYSSVTRTLGANLEKLYLTGNAAIVGIGNELGNVLFGNAGSNTLSGLDGNDTMNGGAGDDKMLGGAGNDTYFVDQAGDQTTEASSTGGTDRVYASLTHTLGRNIEKLYLTGSGEIDGTGNTLNNDLMGNGAGNALNGLAGADHLIGGGGSDTLTGGTGADRFIYTAIADSTAENSDRIVDFSAGDRIDVHLLDANAALANDQSFILDSMGTSGFEAGHIRQTISGADLVLEFNTDADLTAEVRIVLSNHGVLAAGDFIL